MILSGILPRIAGVVVVSVLALGAARAETFSWTGLDNGDWHNPLNWSPGVPVGSDTTVLQFGTTNNLTSTNNFVGGLQLNQLVTGAQTGGLTIVGNTLAFAGLSPSITSGATNDRVYVRPILNLGTNTLSVQSDSLFRAQLDLEGSIQGSGGITVTGGLVGLGGTSSTYTGETRILAGAIAGPLGTGAGRFGASSRIIIEEGGSLQFGQFLNTIDAAKVLTNPITLGGTLESRTKDYALFIAFLPGATNTGAITLTSDVARIRAFDGGTGTPNDAVNFVLTGAVDRAGHLLTVSTGGAGNSVQITGAVGGDGRLTLDPAGGSISLSGGLSGNGDLNLLAGGGSGSLSGAVTVGGDVVVSGSGGGVFTLSTLGGNGQLEVGFGGSSPDRSLRINGLVSDARNLRVTGGELRLSHATNTFTGTIQVSGDGIITADRSSSLGAAANALSFSNGGRLEFTNSFVQPLTRPITTTDGTALLGFRGTSLTISSNITGTGGLALGNNFRAAAVTLVGSNDFQGGLIVGPNLRLVFSNDTNLGAAGGFVRLAGTGAFSTPSIEIPVGYTNLTRPLQLAGNETTGGGNLSIAAGQTLRISGDVTGTGVLGLAGTGTFTLAGSNSHSGGISVAGNGITPATLVLDSDARLGAPGSFVNIGRQSGSVASAGQLRAAADLEIAATRSTTFRLMTVDTAGFNVVFNQTIAGRGLTKTGEGTLTLNTANTDASGENSVAISAGSLRMGTADALGTRASVAEMAPGAVLDLNGNNLLLERMANASAGSEIRLGTGGTLHLTTSALFIESRITGSGALVLGATNIASQGFSFAGNSDFTGSITVQHGASLLVLNATALGAAGNALTLDNGTLGASGLSPAPLVIDASSNLTIGPGGGTFLASGQSVVISSALGGSNPLRFLGGNAPDEGSVYDVRLLNPANTFLGNVTLGNAELVLPAVLGIVADG